MSADTILVSLAVIAAALWLGWRLFRALRNRTDDDSTCCGKGCGCVKPTLFDFRKNRSDRRER